MFLENDEIVASILPDYDAIYMSIKNGYIKQKEEDYDNYVYPQEVDIDIILLDGYKLVYGYDYPNEEYKVEMNGYNNRKN